MKFEYMLASELGVPVHRLRDMPSQELTGWIAYATSQGLPQQRLEAILATGFAYVGACLGGKAKARDLIPSFSGPKMLPWTTAKEYIKAWATGLRKHREKHGGKSRQRITKANSGHNRLD